MGTPAGSENLVLLFLLLLSHLESTPSGVPRYTKQLKFRNISSGLLPLRSKIGPCEAYEYLRRRIDLYS